MKRIALIGECMIELNGTAFGSMSQTFGGDTLNTAVYLARSVKNTAVVSYVTAVGTDALSLEMIAKWIKEGIDTSLVLQDPTRQPGLYMIQLDGNGERNFMYWRSDSAARYLMRHKDFPRIEEELAGMDLIYVSGITLAILPREDRSKFLELVKRLYRKGVEIAFDSNYRPKLWGSTDETKEAYLSMYEHTSLALVTDEDERILWGDKTAEETLSRLKELGVRKAVIKMGEKGCLYQDFDSKEEAQHIPAEAIESVIDTTSAGDAFNAGFLAGYLSGRGFRICAKQGHCLAGSVIQRKGAIIPYEETASVIAEFNQEET